MNQSSSDDLKQVLERNRTALNTRDIEGYLNNQTPDVEMVSPGTVLHGREQARQYMEAFLTAFPDMVLTFGDQVFDGDRAVTEVITTGTHTGPLVTPNGPIPPTGKSVTIDSLSILRIKDGMIASERVYFDQLEMMMQLGLMPRAQDS